MNGILHISQKTLLLLIISCNFYVKFLPWEQVNNKQIYVKALLLI